MQFRLHRNNNGWLLKSDKAYPKEEALKLMKELNKREKAREKKEKKDEDAED